MSQTPEVPVGTQPDAAGGDPEKKPNEDTVAYETYKKLLAEKKSRDEKLTQLEGRLKEFEQKDLESKGKHEEVISSLRSQVSDLQGQIKERDEVYILSKAESAVKAKALELGCKNPDKFIQLVGRDKIRSLEVDSKLNVNAQDVDFLVNAEMKDNDFLFKKTRANVIDGDPVEKPVIATPKRVEKMSNEELEDAIRQAAQGG